MTASGAGCAGPNPAGGTSYDVAVSGTRVKVAIGIVLGLGTIGLGVYLVPLLTIGHDYVEPAVCECELLREWVAN